MKEIKRQSMILKPAIQVADETNEYFDTRFKVLEKKDNDLTEQQLKYIYDLIEEAKHAGYYSVIYNVDDGNIKNLTPDTIKEIKQSGYKLHLDYKSTVYVFETWEISWRKSIFSLLFKSLKNCLYKVFKLERFKND